ncbi:hypothetical protein EDD85DRAFT_934170, partial [Armillaria nabsnona]
MEEILLRMSVLSLKAENTASLYGEYITTVINPIVRTIANAAHLSGNTVVERSLGGNSMNPQKDEHKFKVIGATNEEGLGYFENIQVCSDKDEASSVLLSEAEQLGQPFRLDMTRKQKGAAAMAIKGSLQLPRSWALPYPDPEKPLIADVHTEPFLAIVAATVCSKLIAGHNVASPPCRLFLSLPLEEKQYKKEANKDVRSDTGGQIETVPLLVTTNERCLRALFKAVNRALRSPLVPKFYGMHQRPIGGWFDSCVEDVGDNLEELYGSDGSDVKRSMPEMQWRIFLQSVKELHFLGVLHGDLEPRIVAQTAGGFKFFDFGRSESLLRWIRFEHQIPKGKIPSQKLEGFLVVFWEQNPHLKSNQNPDVNTKGFGSGFGSQILRGTCLKPGIWFPKPDPKPFVFGTLLYKYFTPKSICRAGFAGQNRIKNRK